MDTLHLIAVPFSFDGTNFKMRSADWKNRAYRIPREDPGRLSPAIPVEWWNFVSEHIRDCRLMSVVIANAWFSGISLCFTYSSYSEAAELDSVVARLIAECTGRNPEDVEITECVTTE